MGWFGKKAGVEAAKASRGVRGKVHAAGTGRVAWTPRETGALLRAGFERNPVGFRAAKLVAEAAAALPVVLSEDGARMERHPVLSLLERPNGAQGRGEFLEALYGQLVLTGDGYVEAAGEGAELHVLRSDRVRVVPGEDGWPVAYEYRVGSRAVRLAEAGVCHVRAFHPADDHYGMSPLSAAASAVDVHNAASAWSKALLDNAARPSGAIVHRGPDGVELTEQQFERLRAEVEQHHAGARNAGRPMVLDGGLDWKPMGLSPADMEFLRTKEAAAREIATAFGVPPMLLGIPGDATYANYAEANRAFYRLTVLPLAGRVLGRLAGWLGGLRGEGVALSVDLDGVPALAAERESAWARITGADFLSEDEKRRMLGLEG
ncbi:HK97 family phage portal protein [Hasllibacter halocynthiae]|uniref:HK97 family phage portal protein n=1 Tax=Hasllibacter halocynthiae TaxID=595589 RepID=A0A2T0X8U6_9RHOB|nr:phage portal protein [Hasllibacter halocynthiae]PRY95371.1 HK97 family phage portal protein [Hasllibacter halocynthiae]